MSALPRLAAAAIGVVLVAACVMKATDMAFFVKQITAYGLLGHPLVVTWSAWGMIGIQSGLGLALLLFYRPRLSLGLASLLWLGLFCLTAWAWASGTTDECGCYGHWLKTTPKSAMIENLVFLSLTLASWKTCPVKSEAGNRGRGLAVGCACCLGLALPLLLGFPVSAMINPRIGSITEKQMTEIRVTDIKDVNLGPGPYLVVLLGTDCPHCRELLPQIDELATRKKAPRVIALSRNSEAEVRRFVDEFAPSFPVGRIKEKEFWDLLGKGKMPRMMLVKDGRVHKVWDGAVPSPDDLW